MVKLLCKKYNNILTLIVGRKMLQFKTKNTENKLVILHTFIIFFLNICINGLYRKKIYYCHNILERGYTIVKYLKRKLKTSSKNYLLQYCFIFYPNDS